MKIRNRRGIIKLSRNVVLSMNLRALSLLFGNFFPLRTDIDSVFEPDIITYYGVSMEFDEVEEGDEIPLYDPQIELDSCAVKFVKL